MPKANLGDKHLCEGCGAKFYDMKKKPPTCPACGVVHEVETKRKSRAAPAAPAAKKKPLVTKPKEEVDDDDVAVESVAKSDLSLLFFFFFFFFSRCEKAKENENVCDETVTQVQRYG